MIHRISILFAFLVWSIAALCVCAQEKKYDWRAHKAQLERERKQAEPFIGTYKRGDDEFVEFYISKESKYTWFRGRFFGIGKYDYEFAISDLVFNSDGSIFFKVKGKPYKARRIDESLELTLPDGAKRYCPRVQTQSAQATTPR
ncbi:MAG: hypothetical protein SNJ55_05125 [Chloroherpetonaceae bacterium]